ncbi:hypothetical protein LCGC14_1774870, partial [marine sediment metagenome]
DPANLKFNEMFLGNDWELYDGVSETFGVVDTDALLEETYVRELYFDTNYDLPEYKDELRVRYNYDTNKRYVSDYNLIFGYEAGVNNINNLKYKNDGESLDFNSKYSSQIGLRLLQFNFEYNFNLLAYTEYTFQVEIQVDSGRIDMLRISYYDKDDNFINRDYYDVFDSFTTSFTIKSITSDTSKQRIYFALDDITNFGVNIDYAWLIPKQDKIYSYMELKDSEYLTNYDDTSVLTFTNKYGIYPTTIEVYEATTPSTPPIWNNKPSMTSFISSNLIYQGSTFDLDLNYPRNGYIGLKTLDFGFDFESGPVTRTDTLSKFYQGQGMVYIQTNTNDELMNIKSPVYTNAIMTEFGDKIQIRIQAKTDDLVTLTFYNNGQENASIPIIPQGNSNFNEQVIQITLTDGIVFDQIGLTVELDDKEYIILHSVSIADAEKQDFELETIISSYSFDSFTYNEETSILNSPKETYLKDEIYWTLESEPEGINEKVEVLFDVEIPEGKMEGVERFEIQLNITSSISLSTQYFAYFDFNSYQYIQFTPDVNGDLLTFNITNIENCKEGSLYKIRFKFKATSASYFQISIDLAQVVTYGMWLMSYDVYRLAFTFDKFGGDSSDSVYFSLFEDIFFTIYDLPDTTTSPPHIVEFYYDFNTKKLSAYFNDNSADLLNNGNGLENYNFYNPRPVIKSQFASANDGITLLYIESQYYKRIANNRDFEEYKTLLTYYNSLRGYAAAVNLTQAEINLNPVNLFAYLSAEIDVMYSFNDNMVPENIFGMSLIPTYSTSLNDDIGTSTYDEKGFVIRPYDETQETAYYASASQFGDFYFDTPGEGAPPGSYGYGEITGELINVGGTYTSVAPGYNYWGAVNAQPDEFPSSTIYNDDFSPTTDPHLNVNDEINPAIIRSDLNFASGQYNSYIVPDVSLIENWG